MWGKRLLALSFFGLLLLVSVSAQDISSQNSPMMSTENAPRQNWDSLEELLELLKSEATLQSEDLMKLSEALEQSRTEIEGLRTSLSQSEQQLASLEQSMIQQAQLYKQMEQQKNLWKIVAITSLCLLSTGIVASIVF